MSNWTTIPSTYTTLHRYDTMHDTRTDDYAHVLHATYGVARPIHLGYSEHSRTVYRLSSQASTRSTPRP